MSDSRNPIRDVILLLGSLVLAAVLAPTPAAAYLDPLSGSLILQLLMAGFLAGSLTVKRFWSRISDGLREMWIRLVGGR